jgi:hypothetical protein
MTDTNILTFAAADRLNISYTTILPDIFVIRKFLFLSSTRWGTARLYSATPFPQEWILK